MTNLDVVMAGQESGSQESGSQESGSQADGDSVRRARSELSRMATSLATVQALSQADLAQPSWFEPMDVGAIGDVADEVVSRASTGTDSTIDLEVDPTPSPPVTHPVWPDGVRLALDNVLRNAVSHGRPIGGVARSHRGPRRCIDAPERHRRRQRARGRARSTRCASSRRSSGVRRPRPAADSASPSPTGSPAPTVVGSRSCRAPSVAPASASPSAPNATAVVARRTPRWSVGVQLRPTMLPSASMSMRCRAGDAPRPGMVLIAPQIG